MIYQIIQQRFRYGTIGVVQAVRSLWVDAPTAEAANREYRQRNKVRSGDWTLVTNLESGQFEARVFD